MSSATQRDETHAASIDNRRIADALDEIAELLEAQGANAFRIRAYRQAARNVRQLDEPVRDIVERDGPEALQRLPGIGASLGRTIDRLATTGRLPLLERLRGEEGSERILATVPGIGRELAARIHDVLGVETLADLEASAHDGRLSRVPGFGPRRVLAVRESLAGRFRRRTPPLAVRSPSTGGEDVPVAELLDVDSEYRRKAAHGRLPCIAPRRFNPTGAAWLPILHTQRGDRHFTALFSNTARAHELGMTNDWVVVYRDDHGGQGQWTVVTGRFGSTRGQRVVRGREAECEALPGDLF